MRFREAPVGVILIVGNTADGPVLARKLANELDNGYVKFNAHWTNEQGELRGVCIIMEDQEVEVYSTNDANLTGKPVKPKSRTSKRTGRGSASRGMPAAGSNSGGEGMG